MTEISPELFTKLRNIAFVTAEYRAAEQEDTPRIWRGKRLQDAGEALDAALEEVADLIGLNL